MQAWGFLWGTWCLTRTLVNVDQFDPSAEHVKGMHTRMCNKHSLYSTTAASADQRLQCRCTVLPAIWTTWHLGMLTTNGVHSVMAGRVSFYKPVQQTICAQKYGTATIRR